MTTFYEFVLEMNFDFGVARSSDSLISKKKKKQEQ
jgi:hypothetical protein